MLYFTLSFTCIKCLDMFMFYWSTWSVIWRRLSTGLDKPVVNGTITLIPYSRHSSLHSLLLITASIFSDHEGIRLLIMLFVDDGLMISNSPDEMDLVLALFMKDVYITKVTMYPKLYVDVHIKRDRLIELSTSTRSYISILFCRNSSFKTTMLFLLLLNRVLIFIQWPNATDEPLETTFPYAQLIGGLQFAALTTRSDIAYSVNNATQFKNHPTTANCNVVWRILKYIRGTSDYHLT